MLMSAKLVQVQLDISHLGGQSICELRCEGERVRRSMLGRSLLDGKTS
jgi:hypothetical protein